MNHKTPLHWFEKYVIELLCCIIAIKIYVVSCVQKFVFKDR